MSKVDQTSSPVPSADKGGALRFGSCRFDRHRGILQRDGTEVALTPKALSILECLLDRPGRVVPKQELIDEVWGGTAVTDHSLTEAVRTLRKALDDDPEAPTYIQTVHRRGYRFIATVHKQGE